MTAAPGARRSPAGIAPRWRAGAIPTLAGGRSARSPTEPSWRFAELATDCFNGGTRNGPIATPSGSLAGLCEGALWWSLLTSDTVPQDRPGATLRFEIGLLGSLVGYEGHMISTLLVANAVCKNGLT